MSWIPPEQVCELRALLQLYRDLREEHTAWAQRIHATLFHQGGQDIGLSPTGAQAVAAALHRMDDLEAEIAPVHAQIAAFARRQIGCKTLTAELYGVGPLIAAIVWAFLGDTRRFSSSAQAVRHTGLDVTVYSSDDKRAPGYLSHQGPPILRWALFEAGHQGARASSPDHLYYTDVPRGSTPAAPRCRSPASSPAAPTTSCAASAIRPTPPCRLDGEANAGGSGGPHAADAQWPPPVAGALEGSCRYPCTSRLDGLERLARPHPQAGPPHRSSCRRDRSCLADRGKAGRPRHPHTPTPEPVPEEPMT